MIARALPALLLAAMFPSLAAATEFRDAGTGFRITLDFGDAQVCISKPKELTDAAGCEGIDLTQAGKGTSDPRMRLVAHVRKPDGGRWLMAALVLDRPPGPFTTTTAVDIANGVRQGFRDRFADVELLKPADFVVHGATAFRFENTWAPGRFPYDAAWTAIIVGEQHLVELQIMGTSADLAGMERAGDAMLRTAYEAHPGKTERDPWTIGRVLRTFPLFLLLAAIGVIAFAISFARRRRGARP
jgi:hypothetical protein